MATVAKGYNLDYAWRAVGEAYWGAGYYLAAAEAGEPPGTWRGPGAERLGFAVGQQVEREPYNLLFGERKGPDGHRLGRAPANAGKAVEIYQGLVEPVTLVSATRMLKLAPTRITAVVTSWPRHLSDRIHRDGDALARRQGWEIVMTTGRFGVNGRAYRDPRFAQHAHRAGWQIPVASTANGQNLGAGHRRLKWPGGRSG